MVSSSPEDVSTSSEPPLVLTCAIAQSRPRSESADPSYAKANPTNEFFASLVPITTYRPAYAVYPRISNEIQVATEAVMTGTSSVQDAAKAYDDQVKSIAGDAVMQAAG